MSQETKKILEMLSAGQITADDAERLLDKLGTPGAGGSVAGEASAAEGKSIHDRARDIGDQVRDQVEAAADGKSSSQRVGGSRIPPRDQANGQKLRFLRIVVDKPDEDQVNVRVPLAFLRAGMKLLGVIPPQAAAKLEEKGIDLGALRDLKGGELVDELKDLHVDVDSKNGDKVRIYCE